VRIDNPCPLCGKPIPDTGYVCHSCTRLLRGRLRWTAAMLDLGELDVTIGRQSVTSGSPSLAKVVEQLPHAGPWCEAGWLECGHASCRLIGRSWVRRRLEPAAAHEDAGPLNLDAAEVRYVLDNVARAWADHIHRTRGAIIPVRRPRVVTPEVLEVVHERSPVEWCDFGDLPAAACACGNPNATHPRRDLP
jgi:hypothetical protein